MEFCIINENGYDVCSGTTGEEMLLDLLLSLYLDASPAQAALPANESIFRRANCWKTIIFSFYWMLNSGYLNMLLQDIQQPN
jgi:hypothetical protein